MFMPAENLIHMGFQTLHLIDPDRLELSNLNRIVGISQADAQQGRLKVEAVAEYLRRINPRAQIDTHPVGIEDPKLEPIIAGCDWILLSTDSHTSRAKAQELSLRYFVPLIAAGVNIGVEDGRITDMSGEVILARAGDQLCLHCLGRVDPIRLAAESHPESEVRDRLVERGYVTGLTVKEPAVKTLNATLAALAVETLVNQYTGRQRDVPVLVYENNRQPVIYPDTESVRQRNNLCYSCGI
jgi:molybdopterin/thiamine biosynthesis adenylyltransferase